MLGWRPQRSAVLSLAFDDFFGSYLPAAALFSAAEPAPRFLVSYWPLAAPACARAFATNKRRLCTRSIAVGLLHCEQALATVRKTSHTVPPLQMPYPHSHPSAPSRSGRISPERRHRARRRCSKHQRCGPRRVQPQRPQGARGRRCTDVSGMTEKARGGRSAEGAADAAAGGGRGRHTPAAAIDEVPFDPLAALIGADGVALDGSAFEAAADQPMDDLDFDPRVSPHAYEAAPSSVGIIIADHGHKPSRRRTSGWSGSARATRRRGRRSTGSCGRRMELASPSMSRGLRRRWWRRAAPRSCATPSFCRRGGTSGRDAGAAGRGGESAQYSVLADAAAGGSAGALGSGHDVRSAGVKDATPDADDGGFGFFGAIAEMIEAENAR